MHSTRRERLDLVLSEYSSLYYTLALPPPRKELQDLWTKSFYPESLIQPFAMNNHDSVCLTVHVTLVLFMHESSLKAAWHLWQLTAITDQVSTDDPGCGSGGSKASCYDVPTAGHSTCPHQVTRFTYSKLVMSLVYLQLFTLFTFPLLFTVLCVQRIILLMYLKLVTVLTFP